jgi:hypothetical protein
MSAVRFKDLPRALDGSSLSPGATLAFYVPATLTPRSTYADGARTVSSPNPITADAAARLQPFWLDPALEYRAILTDADGVEIYDEDPVGVFPGTDTGIPLNDSGEPMPFARRTFWRSGTTALLPIYADASLTTELDNPITADIAGEFPDIYLDDQVEYRSLLHDGDGVLIYDVDPIQFFSAPPPDFGTAIQLDAFNFSVGATAPANAAYDFGVGSFTFQCWLRVDAHNADFSRRIIRLTSGSGGSIRRWEMIYFMSGTTNCTTFGASMRNGATTRDTQATFTPVPNGTWMQFTAVVKRAPDNLVEFYKDGAFIGSMTTATLDGLSVSSSAQTVEIINVASITVDDLRIWNVALTAEEIADNYSAPLAHPTDDELLVGYWKFNEGSGTFLADSSNTGNNATLDEAIFVAGPP